MPSPSVPPVAALFVLLAVATAAAQEGSAADRLPFSSEETTGSLEVVVRHRLTWNRSSGAVSWDRLHAEISELAQIEVEPGSYQPKAEADQTIGIQMAVRNGRIGAELTLRPDGTWTAPIQAVLGPRDLQWKQPRVDVRQVALAGNLGLDSSLTEEPLKGLKKLNLAPLKAESLSAGVYEAREVEIRGAWSRPEWVLEHFEAQTFGGRLAATGRGAWGTADRPVVSLEVEMEDVDLNALLKAFNVARADQIRARVRGRAHLEAEGRDWKVLDLDLIGKEGTVFLSRKLLYDILSPSLTEVLTRKQIDDALNSVYGRKQMIPFEELSFEGSLTPRSLNLRLPLRNEVLDLDIEPQIDRELLWDIYDELAEVGAENVRGVEAGPGTAR